MTKQERLKRTVAMLREPKRDDDEREILAAAVWHQLSGAAKDTLNCLVNCGPCWDGDVPSKSGRDELLEFGLVSKAFVEGRDGFQVANYLGGFVFNVGYYDVFDSSGLRPAL